MICRDRRLLEANLPGERVVQVPSMRHSRLGTSSGRPLALVWHSTDLLVPGAELAQRLTRPPGSRPASWHHLICRDGTLIQSVPMDRAAWHCKAAGRAGGVQFRSMNLCSVGVELEAAGRLKPDGSGGFYCWPYYRKPGDRTSGWNPALRVPDGRAVQVDGPGGGWWDSFTPAQVATAEAMLRALVDAFHWPRVDASSGHCTWVDPDTKEDPGPLWMRQLLPGILDRVFPQQLGVA